MAHDGLRFLSHTPSQSNPHYNFTNIRNKPASINQYVSYMLNRTNEMFEYSNLPPTITAHQLEWQLQYFGYAAFIDIPQSYFSSQSPTTRAGLYTFQGGTGGLPDIYGRNTTFILANPCLTTSHNLEIVYDTTTLHTPIPSFHDGKTVIMRNDTNYLGLLPIYYRYAAELAENDISIRSAQINARAQIGIVTSTDRDREAAKKYFKNLEDGELGVIGDSAFIEGISVANVGVNSANAIIQLIELQQYLKASWYNELGLNVNYNMKREYISRDEIATTTDILLPLVDDMFECRLYAISLINELFGTNIEVRKGSAWASKETQVNASLAEQAKESGLSIDEEPTPPDSHQSESSASDSAEQPATASDSAEQPATATASDSAEQPAPASDSAEQPATDSPLTSPQTPIQIIIQNENEIDLPSEGESNDNTISISTDPEESNVE